MGSKVRFARYAATAALTPVDELLEEEDSTAAQALDAAGIDDRLLETVIRPFLAGVFLEDRLESSRRFLDLILRSFAKGTPSLPAAGMQAIAHQLLDALPADTVALDTKVTKVAAGKVHLGRRVASAKAVVVATDPMTAGSLLPSLDIPQGRAATTWYFVADVPGSELTHGQGALIVDGLGPVLNTVVLTNAAPSYAPDGRTLVAASALGLHDCDAARVRALAHLSRLYGHSTTGWEHVATYAIPYALPAMLPPLDIRRPVSLGDGLFVAGDHRDTASIQGAMVSGRRTAAEVLTHLGITIGS